MQSMTHISPGRTPPLVSHEVPPRISATADAPSRRKWFVLHTRPRQEKSVARALHAMDIEHRLPLQQTVRYERRRKVQSALPMFPGYVFLHGTLDQAYAADRTGRVVQLIHVADQARMAWELQNVAFAMDHGAALEPWPYLRAGRRAAVIAGPFQGLQGVVEGNLTNDRLVLQVETLGQAASLEIENGLLEAID